MIKPKNTTNKFFTNEDKEIFSIRKFTTGTHSARLGILTAGAVAVATLGAVSPSSANELTAGDVTPASSEVVEAPSVSTEVVVETPVVDTPVSEVSAPVMELAPAPASEVATVESAEATLPPASTTYETATNFTDLQKENTPEMDATLALEGEKEGEVDKEIISEVKNDAVDKAKAVGVEVQEKPMADTDELKKANESNAIQTDRVNEATATKIEVDGVSKENASRATAGNVEIIQAPTAVVFKDDNKGAVAFVSEEAGRVTEAVRAQNSIDESLLTTQQEAVKSGVTLIIDDKDGKQYKVPAEALKDLADQLARLESATATQREIDSIIALALADARRSGVQINVTKDTPTTDIIKALDTARKIVANVGDLAEAQTEADKRIDEAELVARTQGVSVTPATEPVRVGSVKEATDKSTEIANGLIEAGKVATTVSETNRSATDTANGAGLVIVNDGTPTRTSDLKQAQAIADRNLENAKTGVKAKEEAQSILATALDLLKVTKANPTGTATLYAVEAVEKAKAYATVIRNAVSKDDEALKLFDELLEKARVAQTKANDIISTAKANAVNTNVDIVGTETVSADNAVSRAEAIAKTINNTESANKKALADHEAEKTRINNANSKLGEAVATGNTQIVGAAGTNAKANGQKITVTTETLEAEKQKQLTSIEAQHKANRDKAEAVAKANSDLNKGVSTANTEIVGVAGEGAKPVGIVDVTAETLQNEKDKIIASIRKTQAENQAQRQANETANTELSNKVATGNTDIKASAGADAQDKGELLVSAKDVDAKKAEILASIQAQKQANAKAVADNAQANSTLKSDTSKANDEIRALAGEGAKEEGTVSVTRDTLQAEKDKILASIRTAKENKAETERVTAENQALANKVNKGNEELKATGATMEGTVSVTAENVDAKLAELKQSIEQAKAGGVQAQEALNRKVAEINGAIDQLVAQNTFRRTQPTPDGSGESVWTQSGKETGTIQVNSTEAADRAFEEVKALIQNIQGVGGFESGASQEILAERRRIVDEFNAIARTVQGNSRTNPNPNSSTDAYTSSNKTAVRLDNYYIVASGDLTPENIKSGAYSIKVIGYEDADVDPARIVSNVTWSDGNKWQPVDGGQYADGQLINKLWISSDTSLRAHYDMNENGTTTEYGTMDVRKWYRLSNAVTLADGSKRDLFMRGWVVNPDAIGTDGTKFEVWNQDKAINAINGYNWTDGRLGTDNGMYIEYRIGDLADTTTKYLWTNIVSDLDKGQYLQDDESVVLSVGGNMTGADYKRSSLDTDDYKGINTAPNGTIVVAENSNTYGYTVRNQPNTANIGALAVARADFGTSAHMTIIPRIQYEASNRQTSFGYKKLVANYQPGQVKTPTLTFTPKTVTPAPVVYKTLVAQETPPPRELRITYNTLRADLTPPPTDKEVEYKTLRAVETPTPTPTQVTYAELTYNETPLPKAPELKGVLVPTLLVEQPIKPTPSTVNYENINVKVDYEGVVVEAPTAKVQVVTSVVEPRTAVETHDIDMQVDLQAVRIQTEINPVRVVQKPANFKSIVDTDEKDINGMMVAKNSKGIWVLSNEPLKAGRPVTTSYELYDLFVDGQDIDIEATLADSPAYEYRMDTRGDRVFSLKSDILRDVINLDLDSNVAIPKLRVHTTFLNDMADYDNVFRTVVNGGTTGNVFVNYYEEGTDKVLKPRFQDVEEAVTGSSYDTTDARPEIIVAEDGNLYQRTPKVTGDGEQGIVTEKDKVVNYFYKKVEPKENFGNVVTSYVDEEGNPIAKDFVNNLNTPVGEKYDTTPVKHPTITHDGITYELVPNKTMGIEKGEIVEGTQHVTYVYKRVTPERPKGDGYTVTSNKVGVKTPGKDVPTDPNDPNYDPKRPNDSVIKPEKHNYDKEGNVIDDKTLLPNAINHYRALHDLNQYKGINLSKDVLAKFSGYIDDFDDNALVPLSDEFRVYLAGTQTEAKGFKAQVIEDITLADKAIQEYVTWANITPIGKFILWTAEDPIAFYKDYVAQGQSIEYYMPMAIAEGFSGEYTNSVYQIDFGNGYFGNTVKNNVPKLEATKDVSIEIDGESLDGKVIAFGQEFHYTIKGAILTGDRAERIWQYDLVDDYDQTGDQYLGEYSVFASTDIKVTRLFELTDEAVYEVDTTLADGTVVKAGDKIPAGTKIRVTETIAKGTDLTNFTISEHDEIEGKITIKFKDEFLETVLLSSDFGADYKFKFKRIAYGEFENTAENIINGVSVKTNTVKTSTPQPPAPETPEVPATPTPEVPVTPVTPVTPETPVAEAPAQPALPNTGEDGTALLTLVGATMTLGAFLAMALRRKEG